LDLTLDDGEYLVKRGRYLLGFPASVVTHDHAGKSVTVTLPARVCSPPVRTSWSPAANSDAPR
jgi:hypothetical protein